MITNSPELITIPVGLGTVQNAYGLQIAQDMASAVVGGLPLLIVVVLFQRRVPAPYRQGLRLGGPRRRAVTELPRHHLAQAHGIASNLTRGRAAEQNLKPRRYPSPGAIRRATLRALHHTVMVPYDPG